MLNWHISFVVFTNQKFIHNLQLFVVFTNLKFIIVYKKIMKRIKFVSAAQHAKEK
jgi:hypothetical protein